MDSARIAKPQRQVRRPQAGRGAQVCAHAQRHALRDGTCAVLRDGKLPDAGCESSPLQGLHSGNADRPRAVTGSAYTQGVAAVHAGPGLYPVHAGPAQGHDVGQEEVRSVVVDRGWDGCCLVKSHTCRVHISERNATLCFRARSIPSHVRRFAGSQRESF